MSITYKMQKSKNQKLVIWITSAKPRIWYDRNVIIDNIILSHNYDICFNFISTYSWIGCGFPLAKYRQHYLQSMDKKVSLQISTELCSFLQFATDQITSGYTDCRRNACTLLKILYMYTYRYEKESWCIIIRIVICWPSFWLYQKYFCSWWTCAWPRLRTKRCYHNFFWLHVISTILYRA